MSIPPRNFEPMSHQATVSSAVGQRYSAVDRRWVLFMLGVAFTLNFMDRSIINILSQPIKTEFHLSDFQLGALGGFMFVVLYAIGGIPAARLSEHRDRVTVLSSALTLWSVMTALCGLASGFWQLALCRIGVGVGEAGCSPAAQSIISDYFSSTRRATAMSIYSLGAPFGALIGVVAGGWVAQDLGWRAAFLVVGLPGLAVAVIMRLTVKDPPRGGTERFGSLHAETEIPSLRAVLKALMSKPAFIQICIGFSLANIAAYGMTQFIFTYFLRQFQLDLKAVSLTVGIVGGLSAMGGTLAGGLVSDWFGRRDSRWYLWTPAVGLVIASILNTVTFLQNDWAIAVQLLILPGLFQNTYLGTSFGTVHNLVAPRMRASATAILFLVINLAGMGIGPPLVGALSDFFARATMPIGNFAAMCQGRVVGDGVAPAIAAACRHASAIGNRYALIASSAILIWSALHYYLAGRHLPSDLRKEI